MPPQAKLGIDLTVDGRKALKQVKGIAGKASKAFSKIKPIAGLALGAGGAFAIQSAIKKTIDFDVALTRLAIQAKLTKEEQAGLRDEIQNVAQVTGIAKDQLLAAGQSIIDATGDAQFMRDTLEEVALMSQVTGADMAGMGRIVSDLKVNFNLTGKEANQMLRIITEQGEKGKFTLVEFAQDGSKAFSAMALAGIKTQEQIKQAAAELQVMRRGFSTSSETATAYLTIIRRLATQSDKLAGMGVQVFADEDKTKMRTIADIMTDVFTNVGQSTDVLSELFGESVAGVQAFSTAFDAAKKEGKDLKGVLKDFNDVTGDSERFQKDLGRIMDTTGGKMLTFQQKLDKIFDEAFMKNVDDLAGYLPEFTKLIKFLADHKDEIIAIWGLGKLGAFSGAGAVPVPGGGGGGGVPVPVPKAPGVPAAPAAGGGLASLLQSIGIALGVGQVQKGILGDISQESRSRAALEKVLGRKMTAGEKTRLSIAETKLGLGTGGTFEKATPQELAKIFGNEISGKFNELETTLKGMKLEAKVTVSSPSIFASPTGTQPTTKTEATQ